VHCACYDRGIVSPIQDNSSVRYADELCAYHCVLSSATRDYFLKGESCLVLAVQWGNTASLCGCHLQLPGDGSTVLHQPAVWSLCHAATFERVKGRKYFLVDDVTGE
jgi:hypothetical protein